MEIAAAPAPRRQLLVAATGDWTKTTMTVEGPGVEKAYRLLDARERLHYEIHDFPHNYNQTTREVVYSWFNHWLLGAGLPVPVKELPHTPLTEETVRVFPGAKQPAGALTEEEFIRARMQEAAVQLSRLIPSDRRTVEEFKRVQSVAWRHNLQLDVAPQVIVERGEVMELGTIRATRLAFGRPGRGDRIPAVLLAPKSGKKSTLVVVVHPEGKGASLDAAGRPVGLAGALVQQGFSVLLPDLFLTGENARPDAAAKRNYFDKFFTTYNRTDIQERVQDLITACMAARKELGARKTVLAGVGRAGLWTVLAAPVADGVAADCAGVSDADDKELLAQDLFTPGLQRMGGFAGVAALAAPHPALLHNAKPEYGGAALRASYAAAKGTDKLRLEGQALDDSAVAAWIAAQFGR
jgi:hypothetical protein